MNKITAYEIIDHGIDNEQYFPGCGVYGTNFRNVVTGIGEDTNEAFEDAKTQIVETHGGGIEFGELEDEELVNRSKVPHGEDVSEEIHVYISIRYNLLY